MITGRRKVLAGMLGVVVAGVLPALPARSAGITLPLKLDFGGTTPPPADGYSRVLTNQPASTMTTARPWGWNLATGMASRNRNTNVPPPPAPLPPLYRDFIFGPGVAGFVPPLPRVFTIGFLTPGRYRLTFLTGEHFFGDHTTRITVPGIENLTGELIVGPPAAHYATVTATVVVPTGSSTINITFDAEKGKTWLINGLILESVTDAEVPKIIIDPYPFPASLWTVTANDPTDSLMADHRARVANNPTLPFQTTGLTRSHYLSLITSEVDFWKTKQNLTTGAIIDPYRNIEFQYSTPSFAHAAATLVAYAGRADLLEAAALALDWSAKTLSNGTAASGHEDFFAPMIAHSIRLLKDLVPAARLAQWKYYISSFEPYEIYVYGAGVNNWNVVAACGEAMFQQMGIRGTNHKFVAESFALQGDNFDSTYGLYLEEAMPYDHFPRLWVADLLARGYTGPYSAELDETLQRASVASLLMQSPTGELPSGGRSAHHQWNEAAECVTFEIYAARALANGDMEAAGYFKRAAHLALSSLRRWIRPTGEMQIIKNWIDPSQTFAYETYSAHSQYNLLPMSMLSSAFEHAATTEDVPERPAPADIGGFVFQFAKLDKVFANAGGAYVEIETAGDHHYDATGLIRVHFTGHVPQAGISDSVLTAPSYLIPAGSQAPMTTCVGVSWLGTDSIWRHQGELTAAQITSVIVTPTVTTATSVKFSITYSGTFGGGVSSIVEQYELSPNNVQVTTTLPGFNGPVRRVLPLLADDGKTKSKFQQAGEVIKITQPGQDAAGKYIFRLTGASSVLFPTTQYANHSGWARLAVGEYPAGAGQTGVTLRIEAQLA